MSNKTSKFLVALGLGALFAMAGSGASAAEQCRDANGRFTKCPTAAAPAPTRCRNATTKKFVKCGSANAEPVPAAAATAH